MTLLGTFRVRFGYKVNDIPCSPFALPSVQNRKPVERNLDREKGVSMTLWARSGRDLGTKLTIFGPKPAARFMSGCQADYCEVEYFCRT
jgi:hypothetical protein